MTRVGPSQSVRIGAKNKTQAAINATLVGHSVWARWLSANHAAANRKNGIRKAAYPKRLKSTTATVAPKAPQGLDSWAALESAGRLNVRSSHCGSMLVSLLPWKSMATSRNVPSKLSTTARMGRLSLAGRASVAERLRAGAGMIIRRKGFLGRMRYPHRRAAAQRGGAGAGESHGPPGRACVLGRVARPSRRGRGESTSA